MRKSLLILLFVTATFGLLGLNFLTDLGWIEMVPGRACRDAGYNGWVRIDGEGYCWQATESVPVLVEDVQ